MGNGHVKPLDCPAPADLAEFVKGNLPGKAFERVARHVEGCRACETLLGELDDHADPFFSPLRQAAIREGSAEQAVPPDLLAAARSSYGPHPPPLDRPPDGPRRVGKS